MRDAAHAVREVASNLAKLPRCFFFPEDHCAVRRPGGEVVCEWCALLQKGAAE